MQLAASSMSFRGSRLQRPQTAQSEQLLNATMMLLHTVKQEVTDQLLMILRQEE